MEALGRWTKECEVMGNSQKKEIERLRPYYKSRKVFITGKYNTVQNKTKGKRRKTKILTVTQFTGMF